MAHISPDCARKAASQESEDQIIAAYSRLVQSRGIDNITIREICREAKVSNGCFYHHFSTKNDVMRAWYIQFTKDVALKIKASGAETPEEQIAIYFEGYAELNTGLGVSFCRHFYTADNSFLGSHDHESLDVIYGIVVRFLEKEGLSERYTPENIVRYFLIISRGVMFEWGVKEGGFDAMAKMRALVRIAIDSVKTGIYDL